MKTEEYFILLINSTDEPNVTRVKRTKDGSLIKVKKSDVVTIARCKEIIEAVEKVIDGKVIKMQIHHSKFESKYYMDMDNPGIQTLNKKYYYNVAQNCLTIYKNDYPVYCNDNGHITKDQDVLADCLM